MNLNTNLTFCLVLSSLVLNSPLTSQVTQVRTGREISEYAEEQYGPATTLINGEKYYYPYRMASGDPFLEHNENELASVRIQGKLYNDQVIQYDIYNQLVVLEFIGLTGALRSIILRTELLDQFTLGKKVFRKYPAEDGSERFLQVLYEGKVSCYYFWKKRYTPDPKVGVYRYSFSEAIRQSFLTIHGEDYPFKGRRSFLQCLPGADRPTIKTYIQKNRIRIRKASDPEMHRLLEYINQNRR